MVRKTLCLSILLVLIPLSSSAQEVGWIVALEGTANIFHEEVWQPASINSPIVSEDSVRTDPETQALVYFTPNALVVLDPETEIALDERMEGERTIRVIRLLSGRIRCIMRSGEPLALAYQVETGVALVHIEQGDVVVTDLNEVLVLEGETEVWKRGLVQQKQTLEAGSTVTLSFAREIEQFPLKDTMRESLLASLWTLNYPPSPPPEVTLAAVPKLKGRASLQATRSPLNDANLVDEPISQRLKNLFLRPNDPRLVCTLDLIE